MKPAQVWAMQLAITSLYREVAALQRKPAYNVLASAMLLLLKARRREFKVGYCESAQAAALHSDHLRRFYLGLLSIFS